MPDITNTSFRLDSPEARHSTGLLSWKQRAQPYLKLALDVLFPPRCGGCGRVDSRWCARCQRELERIDIALITRPLTPLHSVVSTGVHDGKLRDAVHALKYDAAHDLAPALGRRLIACLRSLNWTIDMIAPVPLHTTRLSERGYNQSQLLTEVVAADLMIPCSPTALTRQHPTRPQVGLNSTQRLENVWDAFYADSLQVRGSTLLLIDDVMTTGATLGACAAAALAVGAQAVYGLTVTAARATL